MERIWALAGLGGAEVESEVEPEVGFGRDIFIWGKRNVDVVVKEGVDGDLVWKERRKGGRGG